jgi:hypothetical protein
LPEKFQYAFDGDHEYAHQFGPVEWIDWGNVSPNWTPQPPAQGVQVIAQANQDGTEVLCRYKQFILARREERTMQNWAALLGTQKQIIFTGPPGTGKTLAAKRLAAFMLTNAVPEIRDIDNRLRGLRAPFQAGQAGAWDIVQFHPSYFDKVRLGEGLVSSEGAGAEIGA